MSAPTLAQAGGPGPAGARFKMLGERVMARDFVRQVAELHAAILNRFTRLGTPMAVVMV